MSYGAASSSGFGCSLHSPVAVSLPFLFFLMYCLTYFFVFFINSTMGCRLPVLIRPSGMMRHVGFCWPVLLALVSTLSFL